MFEEKDDTILARWLSEELTKEEREEFENSPEFAVYQKMVDGMERFEKPKFDTVALKQRVLQQMTDEARPKSKVSRIRPLYISITAAASILFIIGFFFNKVEYVSGVGEQLQVSLPDGSVVRLNASSKLTRSRFFWESNKRVSLEGEAFFDIEKGDGFQVETQSGIVSVLGTEFNIRSRNINFELTCYEGKVSFNTPDLNTDVILTPGDKIKWSGENLDKERKDEAKPDWMNGRSSFSNIDFDEVIAELEAQYGIEVVRTSSIISGHFTGSFVHDDLETALKTVFLPMGVDYVLSPDKKTVTIQSR